MKTNLTLLLAAITTTVSVFLPQQASAQNQNANANAKWGINGNSTATTDFIGTTNNQSLIFKTNNVQRAEFDTQGKLILDGGGEVIIRPGGLNRPILSNPISAYMIKVGGSGHFDGEINTRQLFVQEYITYLKSLKGPRIDVDTIRMDSTRGIFGHTKIFGDVQIKQNLVVDGNAVVGGNFKVAGSSSVSDLNVSGSLVINPSPPATIDPCLQMIFAQETTAGHAQLITLTPHQIKNIEATLDTTPCPTPPVIPFTWQTYGNSVNSNNRWIGTIENFDFNIKTNSILRMVVKNNGQIFFGTKHIQATHLHANSGFQFDGKMACKELVVVDPTKWADFVFDKNYQLMPLQDVEIFYNTNKHLPSVPSEKEVKANGINTAEMDAILLQKIEELTLYIVQQQKEIDALKKATKN